MISMEGLWTPCEPRLLLLRRLYPEQVDDRNDCRSEERQLTDHCILHGICNLLTSHREYV